MEKLTEKQQRKRRQILDAAMHCFIEKGFSFHLDGGDL